MSKGVVFGKTNCVWVKTNHSDDSYTLTASNVWMSNGTEGISDDDNWGHNDIPAPNLQEIIHILPKSIEHNGLTLYFELHCKNIAGDDTYFARYRRVIFDKINGERIVEIHETDDNAIVATALLLKWILATYPETLNK